MSNTKRVERRHVHVYQSYSEMVSKGPSYPVLTHLHYHRISKEDVAPDDIETEALAKNHTIVLEEVD